MTYEKYDERMDRKRNARVFYWLSTTLWSFSFVLMFIPGCLSVSLLLLGQAIFMLLAGRLNTDAARHLENTPPANFKQQVYYIVRRSLICGGTFLEDLYETEAQAECMESIGGGEKFRIDASTILAWYRQVVGKATR